MAVEAPNVPGDAVTVYYLLIPQAARQNTPQGFFPPPPDDATLGDASYQNDFRWTFPKPKNSVTIQHLDPTTSPAGGLQMIASDQPIAWKVDWAHAYQFEGSGSDKQPWTGRDIVLLASLTSPAGLPSRAYNQAVVASVNGSLFFRVFNAAGTKIIDTDESKLTNQPAALTALKAQLAGLFPPHVLTQDEKDKALAAVKAILGLSPSVTIRDFLNHAYLTDPNVTTQVVPISDLIALPPIDNPLTDPRVQNPSEDAYESAVRGAFAEVAAPFFKFDEQSQYDSTLKRAFAETPRSITRVGRRTAWPTRGTWTRPACATQLRGSILHGMLRDLQQYATLDGTPDPNGTMANLRAESLAFRLGVVFRATGPEATSTDPGVRWLEADAGKVEQRSTVKSKAVDSVIIPAGQFNEADDGFATSPPTFLNVRKFEHATMIALAWDISRGDDDLEHHLSHYEVRREHLNGRDPEAVFQVKKGAILHREKGAGISLQPRFQMVDRFDTEVGADVSAVTERGKLYLYTITPIDLSGGASPRPLSIVASRLPADPPMVPGDGELVLTYQLSDTPKDGKIGTGRPAVRQPTAIEFQWSDPPPPAGTTPPAVESYRLIFRRENALPIGFFSADADTRGGRTAGLPVTNARTLRTDRVIVIGRDDKARGRAPVVDPVTGQKVRADSGRVVQRVTVTVAEPQALDVLPSDGVWPPTPGGSSSRRYPPGGASKARWSRGCPPPWPP